MMTNKTILNLILACKIAFLTTIISIQTSAQHISVESFTKLENDMDARVHHPKRDQNGELSAIIKVVTIETGFTFDGGTLGIVASEQKVAEIWVYVPRGALRISIMHPKLGVLRNYAYPISIEAATVYEMRLTTARIETIIIEPEVETQWLVVTSEPDGADVYIDNIHKGQTPLQMELNTGTYSYRIEKPLYHSSAGRVTLTNEKRETINAKLNPNYGYIKVTTTPESGAEITLNGNKLQHTTPHTTSRMPAGEYQITVNKSMFHTETRNVTIGEGKTEEVSLTLKPDYGLLRVVTNPEPGAEVMINGNRHSSKTPFTTERLRTGNYELSVSLPMYHSETREVTIGDGETTEVVFDLRPSYGVVSVSTKPEFGAEVLVNGISTGKKTPCDLDRLPTGQHQVTVRKEWYQPKTIAVNITDGLSDHFEIEMQPTFGILNVQAEHEAEIFVNNDRKATTKWEGRLIAGWYTVEARKDKYHSDQKRVEIKLAETQNMSLHPKPKTGTLRIQTTPFDAQITLNGKDYEKTPATIRDLLIGEYSITLAKQGHATAILNVVVVENETHEISETLLAGMQVTITSEPTGAELFINNQKAGTTPYTVELSFGSHNLKLVNRNKTVEETINVTQGGRTSFTFDVSEFRCGTDKLVDTRDGNEYQTVQIGNRCWMKENLKWLPGVSPSKNGSNTSTHYYVYGYQGSSVSAAKATANYRTYGALYNWPAALNACPQGWHLPSDNEWSVLIDYLGGSSLAGGKMKTTGTTHWRSPNNGATNSNGFSGLPGGYRGTNRVFGFLGDDGYWWSSSEASSTIAWRRSLSHTNTSTTRRNFSKELGFSVRCLKD